MNEVWRRWVDPENKPARATSSASGRPGLPGRGDGGRGTRERKQRLAELRPAPALILHLQHDAFAVTSPGRLVAAQLGVITT